MRVIWILKGLDDLKKKHLEANAEFFKWELMLASKKSVELLQKSRLLKAVSWANPNVKNMVEMLKTKENVIVDRIEEFFNYSLKEKNGSVFFELYIDNSYFATGEVLKQQLGRKISKFVKIYDKHELIDGFTKEIRNTYTKDFDVEIIL